MKVNPASFCFIDLHKRQFSGKRKKTPEMCLARQRVLMCKMEMDKMSVLVEQVPPAGLLRLPILGMASGASVPAPQLRPTVHLSEPFPIHA